MHVVRGRASVDVSLPAACHCLVVYFFYPKVFLYVRILGEARSARILLGSDVKQSEDPYVPQYGLETSAHRTRGSGEPCFNCFCAVRLTNLRCLRYILSQCCDKYLMICWVFDAEVESAHARVSLPGPGCTCGRACVRPRSARRTPECSGLLVMWCGDAWDWASCRPLHPAAGPPAVTGNCNRVFCCQFLSPWPRAGCENRL